MSTYKDDLGALIQSAGFVALKQFARSQWGPTAYNAKTNQMIQRTKTDKDFDLAKELIALETAQRAVNELVSWPYDELRKIAQQDAKEAQPASMMRSGR